MQRPLGSSWKPEYQQNQFCQPTWNNSIGSPTQEHQQQMQQWQFVGAAMDQGGNPHCNSFQGNCNVCGVKGHRTRDHKVKCPHCGKTGHAAHNCFELEANAHRRPQGWRPQRTPQVDSEDVMVQARNGGGMPQEVMQRPCGICQSPAH